MNSLIFCVPSVVTMEDVRKRLLSHGIGAELRDGRLTVSHEGSVAWIESDLDGELEREYEPEELALIEQLIGAWNGFSIDYRKLAIANSIVAAVCEGWECVLDDDNGFIGLGQEYLQHIRDQGDRFPTKSS